MVEVRPETTADYAAIAELTATAFGRVAEALIVTLHRQRPRFDPELSLVAVEDGRIVGYALFTPHQARVLSTEVPLVNLAPLAVEPAYQGKGIGAALIDAGHRAAHARGFVASFLLGHVDYYPRFGYHTGAFGVSSLQVPATAEAVSALIARPPVAADEDALYALWLREEADVDLALDPGITLLDWVSPNPAVQSLVYERDGAVVGFTRIHADKPTSPHVFLAQDDDAARGMVAAIAQGAESVSLPLHPASRSAPAFGIPETETWQAAMVAPLQPSVVDQYLQEVRLDARPPGRPQWPVVFDLA